MEALKDIAHIAGRPGLFKIVKPGRSGVIVAAMDDIGKKEVVSVNAKVSVLKDISIYSTDFNKSTPLDELFTTIREKHGEQIAFNTKTANKEDYFDFFSEIMEDYDPERVYSSDVKKIIQWYNLLSSRMPELFDSPTAKKQEKPKKEGK